MMVCHEMVRGNGLGGEDVKGIAIERRKMPNTSKNCIGIED
jgi:hypothetical protein